MFDRKVYFDDVRSSLFAGNLSQQQVDGQNDILDVWEWIPTVFPTLVLDLRWLAYMLATTFHETSQEMWPIEEYGKGQGMSYGTPDPETGQTYYGRGYVQLTWRDNYVRADKELDLNGVDSCEWHAENALDPVIAAKIMYKGMYEGWFRAPSALPVYFDDSTDDPYNARDIINADKTTAPSWSGGVSIGKLIEGYHDKFLDALTAAWSDAIPPEPPVATTTVIVTIACDQPVNIVVNGQSLVMSA